MIFTVIGRFRDLPYDGGVTWKDGTVETDSPRTTTTLRHLCRQWDAAGMVLGPTGHEAAPTPEAFTDPVWSAWLLREIVFLPEGQQRAGDWPVIPDPQCYRPGSDISAKHFGPGPHPNGTPQEVHGGEHGGSGAVYYHGTSSAFLDQILREGLRAPVDEMFEVNAGRVFVTNSKNDAISWAERKTKDRPGQAVVLHVKAPSHWVQGTYGLSSRTLTSPVPPENILEAWVRDTLPDRRLSWRRVKGDDGGNGEWWVAILLPEETQEKHYGPGAHPGTGTPQEAHSGSDPAVRSESLGPAYGGLHWLVAKHLAREEPKMAKLPRERALALAGDTGRVVFDKPGQTQHVSVDPEEAAALQDAVFTHNHPEDRSFSLDDALLASQNRLREMRAVTTTGIHRLRPGPAGWPQSATLRAEFDAAHKSVHASLQHAVTMGRVTVAEAKHRHGHEVWLRVAFRLPNFLHYEKLSRA